MSGCPAIAAWPSGDAATARIRSGLEKARRALRCRCLLRGYAEDLVERPVEGSLLHGLRNDCSDLGRVLEGGLEIFGVSQSGLSGQVSGRLFPCPDVLVPPRNAKASRSAGRLVIVSTMALMHGIVERAATELRVVRTSTGVPPFRHHHAPALARGCER